MCEFRSRSTFVVKAMNNKNNKTDMNKGTVSDPSAVCRCLAAPGAQIDTVIRNSEHSAGRAQITPLAEIDGQVTPCGIWGG